MPQMKYEKHNARPVSYTHLDVYKRQALCRAALCMFRGANYLPVSHTSLRHKPSAADHHDVVQHLFNVADEMCGEMCLRDRPCSST